MGSIYESNIVMLKSQPDDGFLPQNKPEVFNKTEHGLTDIVIFWDECKPFLDPEHFWK